MARMIPSLNDEQLKLIPSEAEVKFYKACRDQLPYNYLVLHSTPWINYQNGHPQDGETDFTIFEPSLGFIVVEVKGGGVYFVPSTNSWYSIDRDNNRNKLKKSPFEQAKLEKIATINQIKKYASIKGLNLGFIPAGHAVFFPNLKDLEGLIISGSAIEIMGGQKELYHLRKWVNDVFSYWSGLPFIKNEINNEWFEIIEEFYCKPRLVHPLFSTLFNQEERIRIKLTEEQLDRLNLLGRRSRAGICGGAGTGKTLLAVEKSRELASENLNVLLLT